jgi:hypothetical protein
MFPVTVDYFALEKNLKITLDHEPVASEPCCDGGSAMRSPPDQKLHNLKAAHVHEPEDSVCP